MAHKDSQGDSGPQGPQGPAGVGVVITNPDNTAVGDGALVNNTGTGTIRRTALISVIITQQRFRGASEQYTGGGNMAVGYFALFANTTGVSNTATGFSALPLNTTGNYNTANGSQTLQNNTTGFGNTAIGYSALLLTTRAAGTRLLVIKPLLPPALAR